MKRFCAVLSLCVMLFLAVPAFGVQQAALPLVVERVIHNRDFFAKAWALWEYAGHYLYDVNRLDDERIGVSLVAPSGFEVRLVYDVHTLDVIYKDILIPEKSRREAMIRESVSVADAVKLAKNIVEYQGKKRKG